MVTPVASATPLFVTVIVKPMLLPAFTVNESDDPGQNR
jgi:hypothetical protein